MNATLFSEIQRLFERTYAQVGINLEDCLIDLERLRARVRLIECRKLRGRPEMPLDRQPPHRAAQHVA